MSLVNISNITILDNPCTFFDPFRFEITFEVLQELKDDLEFKLIYVGSAESEDHDQTLESVMVGPVPVGVNQFVFEAPAPLPGSLPPNDVLGVTVVLLTCSYLDKEFIRIGYYINNEYVDDELREIQPTTLVYEKSLLAEKPKVTRFTIAWDETEMNMEVEGVQEAESVHGTFQSMMVEANQADSMMIMTND